MIRYHWPYGKVCRGDLMNARSCPGGFTGKVFNMDTFRCQKDRQPGLSKSPDEENYRRIPVKAGANVYFSPGLREPYSSRFHQQRRRDERIGKRKVFPISRLSPACRGWWSHTTLSLVAVGP